MHRSEHDFVLTVDAGNFNDGLGRQRSIKAKYILKGMKLIKYDVIQLGVKDILLGKKYLSSLKKTYDIPFISSNLYDPESQKLFTEACIIKRFNSRKTLGIVHGGFKVGIFGLTSADLRKPTIENDDLAFDIKDPEMVAREMVGKLKRKCDLIVLLSNLGDENSKEIARKINGIDVIVCGNYPAFEHQPTVVNNTIIVQAGISGKYSGELKLNMGHEHDVINHTASLTPLDPTFPDDGEMIALLEEYQDELMSRMTNKPAQSPNRTTLALYMGAEQCIGCHEHEFAQWKRTRHATAFTTLERKGNAHDPNCQKCHTTGYKEFNGFDNLKTTAHMVHVQCEACHGHQYKHMYTLRNVTAETRAERRIPEHTDRIKETVCLKCHDQEHDPDFHFDEHRKKIAHGDHLLKIS